MSCTFQLSYYLTTLSFPANIWLPLCPHETTVALQCGSSLRKSDSSVRPSVGCFGFNGKFWRKRRPRPRPCVAWKNSGKVATELLHSVFAASSLPPLSSSRLLSSFPSVSVAPLFLNLSFGNDHHRRSRPRCAAAAPLPFSRVIRSLSPDLPLKIVFESNRRDATSEIFFSDRLSDHRRRSRAVTLSIV